MATKKTKAQQDDAAGPHTRCQRSAQKAIDRIVASDAPPDVRLMELDRIKGYALAMQRQIASEVVQGTGEDVK